MPIKFNGSFAVGRVLMKQKRQEQMKIVRKLEKDNGLAVEIEKARDVVTVYSLSKTLPVKYKGLIVNGKLLKAFLKKMKGMAYTFFAHENRLRVRYGKVYGEWTGTLELYDLSPHFEDFTDIPEMEESR